MAKQHYGRKRGQPGGIRDEVEAVVDDLAVVAAYASAVYTPPPSVLPAHSSLLLQPHGKYTDEIKLSDSESGSENGDSADGKKSEEADLGRDDAKGGNKLQDGDENGDHGGFGNDNGNEDQSDFDPVEELERMNQVEEEDAGPASAPKTEHELDSYATPLFELEKKFHLNLTVKEGHNERLLGTIRGAGTIQCHMVLERTIVVESCVDGSAAPLDEGSLLVVRIKETLVPLGKIFEVFGPVRKPLYTVRLPTRSTKVNHKESSSKKDMKNDSTSRAACDPNGDTPGEPQPPTEEAEEMEKVDNSAVIQVANTVHSSGCVAINNTEQETHPKENHADKDDTSSRESEQAKSKNDTIETVKHFSIQNEAAASSGQGSSELDDPWSLNGAFTQFIKANPTVTVYYVEDEAKIINPDEILRVSRRGCDASNVFDEEVVNVNEMYFSDDEEERQLKGRNKNRKARDTNERDGSGKGRHHNQQRQRPQTGRGFAVRKQGGPMPSGFHQPSPPYYPPGPHFAPAQFQQQFVPSHQGNMYNQRVPPPPPPLRPPHHYGGPYQQLSHAPGYLGSQYPPPPPPPPVGQPHGYHPSNPPPQAPYGATVHQPYLTNANAQYASVAVPPPPPSGHPKHHGLAANLPTTQAPAQSDTVYYDYT